MSGARAGEKIVPEYPSSEKQQLPQKKHGFERLVHEPVPHIGVLEWMKSNPGKIQPLEPLKEPAVPLEE